VAGGLGGVGWGGGVGAGWGGVGVEKVAVLRHIQHTTPH